MTIQDSYKAGFTLVEMLMVMGLVFIMAAMSMANYNQFGQEIELENGVYELALTVRQAQFFGINRSEEFGGGTFDDPQPYGIYFDLDGEALGLDDRSFVMFVDQNIPTGNRLFDHDDTNDGTGNCLANLSDECARWFGFNRRNYISDICVGNSEANCNSILTLPPSVPRTLHVSFKRPDPDAVIRVGNIATPYAYAKITITSPDAGGESRAVSIGAAGQISIERD